MIPERYTIPDGVDWYGWINFGLRKKPKKSRKKDQGPTLEELRAEMLRELEGEAVGAPVQRKVGERRVTAEMIFGAAAHGESYMVPDTKDPNDKPWSILENRIHTLIDGTYERQLGETDDANNDVIAAYHKWLREYGPEPEDLGFRVTSADFVRVLPDGSGWFGCFRGKWVDRLCGKHSMDAEDVVVEIRRRLVQWQRGEELLPI